MNLLDSRKSLKPTALASPKLLEPVVRVDVLLPEEFTGTVTGDLPDVAV
jgi:translation elongation factor EF-G